MPHTSDLGTLTADWTELAIDGPYGRLQVWTAGDDDGRTPVLFIHPINTQGRIWAEVVALLGPGRRYVLPDLHGHGGSDVTGDFGLDAWTADLTAVIDNVVGAGSFHVVGGSLGGPLAVCVGAAYPDRVRSLTAMGASLHFEGVEVEDVLATFDRLGIPGTFEEVFPTLTFGPDAPREVIDRGLELANHNDVETVKRIWYATISSDADDIAPQVRCPALVINGEHDATCPAPLGLEMARALNTEQVVMPGIGHLPMLECPERIADLVGAHLDRNESPAGAV
ncbi:putative Carboxylesterase [Nostocoides australiense Ben110]|uniref:Putative Carboxylesterase n=1 Tax=Nostocoides australiense Ben110 TaxID=1193182 RepID=W6K0D5_9MICO|nr:alpha/beta hydrolase [Tetrasphaera australiensis]CCH74516.1 putative Carboxylesterase [Tetrasphaera australiensis Ben110]